MSAFEVGDSIGAQSHYESLPPWSVVSDGWDVLVKKSPELTYGGKCWSVLEDNMQGTYTSEDMPGYYHNRPMIIVSLPKES